MGDKYCSDFDEFLFNLGCYNEFMPVEYLGELFHYTSPAGLLSILNGDPNHTTIWASRYDCLNDASEGTVANAIYREVCEDLKAQGTIPVDVFDVLTCIEQAKKVSIRIKKGISIEVKDLECNRFICSFSKNEDLLAMWNYYSKGSVYEGFNIGFYSQAIDESLLNYFEGKNADFHIYPIIYKKSEQKGIVSEFLKTLLNFENLLKRDIHLIQSIISEQLTLWGLIFKSEHFQHEQEVRIIVDIAKSDTEIPIKYRHNAGYIVPYIELKLSKDNISTVNSGPLQCSDKQKSHQLNVMNEMLAQNGYNAIVGCSEIPVRY